MFKKIISYLIIFLFCLCCYPYSTVHIVQADEGTSFETQTLQSVDKDLKGFGFDYEKYLVEKELCYRPILINFNESSSEAYSDLLYIYDPNNLLDESINVSLLIYYSHNVNSLSGVTPNSLVKEAVYDSSNSTGEVKRYSLITEKTSK